MIKENVHFDDLTLTYFPKNMFLVFLLSYRNTCESLGELKSCGNTRLLLMYQQHFLFSQTSTHVTITRWKHGTRFLFLKQHFFLNQTYAVVTSLSEQTKKVVKLNTEDHEPEDIDRGILYMNVSLLVLGEMLHREYFCHFVVCENSI